MKAKTILVAIGGAVTILLLGLTVWLLSHDDATRAQTATQQDNEFRNPLEWSQVSPEGLLTNVDPRHQLQFYKEWAKYPPFSRPLTKGQVDLLHPNRAEEARTKVMLEPGKLSDIACGISLGGRQTVGLTDNQVFLDCVRTEGGRRRRLPITIKEVRVVHRASGRRAAPPVYMGDTGAEGDAKAEDRIYTIVVRPTKKDWGWLVVSVDLKVEELEHTVTTGWFVTPHVVARFRDPIQDSQKDGHLLVTVPIQVLKPGYFQIQANLMEKGGEQRPVAEAAWRGDLEAGLQSVPLTFWGKVIRDADVSGPYVVRNLRGHRNNLAVTPGKLTALMAAGGIPKGAKQTEPEFEYFGVGPEHVTAVYTAASFSGREWEAPEKTERIRFLEETVSREK